MIQSLVFFAYFILRLKVFAFLHRTTHSPIRWQTLKQEHTVQTFKFKIMNRLSLLFALILLISCNQEKVDTEKEGQQLMQLSREWSKSAATDDIEKTVSYWADDAILISSGQPTLNGKQNIREMVVGMSKIPGFKISWEPISVSVSESGDMAYMVEKNKLTYNDSIGNPIITTGRVVTVWEKNNNGEWKNVVDISVDDHK